MTLLELERVGLSQRRGGQKQVVLREVSLSLDEGELVAVWGVRRSGRSTLLRVAAGIERPDSGSVRFAGRDLAGSDGFALGGGIGYCQRVSEDCGACGVIEELLLAALARGTPRSKAQESARAALERVGAERCGTRLMRELNSADAVRVMIARALVLGPSLLVLDEPTDGVDPLERDDLLTLLRSLADEGVALLIGTGEAAALAGTDRALSLADGELRGSLEPELAPVLPMRRRASA